MRIPLLNPPTDSSEEAFWHVPFGRKKAASGLRRGPLRRRTLSAAELSGRGHLGFSRGEGRPSLAMGRSSPAPPELPLWCDRLHRRPAKVQSRTCDPEEAMAMNSYEFIMGLRNEVVRSNLQTYRDLFVTTKPEDA